MPRSYERTRFGSRRHLPPERPDLDRARLGERVTRGDLHRLFEAVALEQIEAADRLFRLHERTVRDQRFPAPDTNRPRPPRRGELVAGQPDPPGVQVVDPRETLFELVR